MATVVTWKSHNVKLYICCPYCYELLTNFRSAGLIIFDWLWNTQTCHCFHSSMLCEQLMSVWHKQIIHIYTFSQTSRKNRKWLHFQSYCSIALIVGLNRNFYYLHLALHILSIGFPMSVCPSKCINSLTGWIYVKFDIEDFLWISIKKIQIWLKSNHTLGTLHEDWIIFHFCQCQSETSVFWI